MAERNPITMKGLVYSLPEAETVEIRRDVPFPAADGGTLVMDLYYPPGRAEGQHHPVVVIVEGYNDVGAERILGCRFKDMVCIDNWGRLIAASGMVAIAATNRSPLADVHALLRHLRENAGTLDLDADRIGAWACSGHGPVALSVLMSDRRLKCAALLYSYTLDLEGSTAVADAQKVFKFENPGQGKTVADLPADLPIFIVKAGKDDPALNEALDRFVSSAQARHLPITLIDHPDGPHGFDLMDDSERSREIIKRALAFLQKWLA
jgi:dienelactone hydrolase